MDLVIQVSKLSPSSSCELAKFVSLILSHCHIYNILTLITFLQKNKTSISTSQKQVWCKEKL